MLFGDQAVGGVINVITRTPDKAALALEAGGGGPTTASATPLSASQRFANGIGVRLSAEQRESDNYRDNNATEYTNALGLVEYNWADGRVFAELQQIDDNLELPGALPAGARAPGPPPEPGSTPQDFADLRDHHLAPRRALRAHPGVVGGDGAHRARERRRRLPVGAEHHRDARHQRQPAPGRTLRAPRGHRRR